MFNMNKTRYHLSVLFFCSESLERIINKRIGVDLFQEKLESLSKSDSYAKTLQKPQLKLSKSNDMILDYEFARLYKILEGSITRMLTARPNDVQTKSSDQSAIILAQYNDLIQQQNQQIVVYQQQEKQFVEERDLYQKKVLELEQSLKEVQEQYILLKTSSEQGKKKEESFKLMFYNRTKSG